MRRVQFGWRAGFGFVVIGGGATVVQFAHRGQTHDCSNPEVVMHFCVTSFGVGEEFCFLGARISAQEACNRKSVSRTSRVHR